MRFVAAPNPFKGTLGAPAAARAIALGVRDVLPGADVDEVPVADGGEGTVEALVAARGGEVVTVTVTGPLGDPVPAAFGLIDGGRTAVVELAAASGLPLLSPERRDPRITSTYGFGELLEAARARGVRRVIAGVGGSATNDAGAGMAQALGFRLVDRDGRDLPRGGAALSHLARIEGGADPAWRDVEVEVAVDVTNPLTGPEGASVVYGPQKGATPDMVRELDAALCRFAAVAGGGIADTPGAGAAGGAGAGLLYFLSARLTRGAPLVVGASGLDERLQGARAVFTGEGRVDAQTAYGKGPVEVARRARAAGVEAVLIAGGKGAGWEAVLAEGVSFVETLDEDGRIPREKAEARARELLRGAAARASRRLVQT